MSNLKYKTFPRHPNSKERKINKKYEEKDKLCINMTDLATVTLDRLKFSVSEGRIKWFNFW